MRHQTHIVGLFLILSLIACTASNSAAQVDDETARILKENDEQNQALLKRAQDALNKATAHKENDPTSYINALVQVAVAYQGVHNQNKADELFDVAMETLRNCSTKVPDVLAASWMLFRYLPSSKFDEKFTSLLQINEQSASANLQNLDTEIQEAISQRGYGTNPGVNPKNEWKKVIDVRASIRGQNDESLSNPLVQYAYACESRGDLREAEGAWLRSRALLHKSEPINDAKNQLILAEFYQRTNKFDKATATWKQSLQMEHGHITWPSMGEYVNLINEYRRIARFDDMNRLIDVLLEIGGDAVVRSLDPCISDLVDSYTSSGQIERAQVLIQKRLAASEKCKDDKAANDWRIKLSDILLAQGKTAESTELFDRVVGSMALQRLSTQTVLRRRAELLERLGHKTESDNIKKSLPPQSRGPVKIQYRLLTS